MIYQTIVAEGYYGRKDKIFDKSTALFINEEILYRMVKIVKRERIEKVQIKNISD